jgi:hypothetical protein
MACQVVASYSEFTYLFIVYLMTVPDPLLMFALTVGYLVHNEDLLWKETAET